MIDILGFILIILPIALSPGTSFVLAMSNVSIAGFKSIFPVLLGTGIGITAHALLAGIGVSKLLSQNQTAMALLQFIGIAFLIFLGVRLIIAGVKNQRAALRPESELRSVVSGVKDALILNLVNVRAIVLYITVIPALAGNKLTNFLVLSSVHILILSLWIISCAILLSSANKKLRLNSLRFIINVLGGLSLIGFAGKLLLQNLDVFR